MIKVKNEVKVYEHNGEDIALLEDIFVGIESHWNNKDKVVVVINGERYAVVAEDLLCAVTNATNSNR